MIDSDKLIERERYDARARSQMKIQSESEIPLGSLGIPAYLRSPYICYEQKIAELIRPDQRVLELGAGTGEHTWALLKSGARVVASDISPDSIKLIKQRFLNKSTNLQAEVADMESLPFEASSFDVVVSAGSLSYGDPHLVDMEIKRVLKPGGTLICVDSLNHNPVYRLNRWVHYLRGNRSRNTLKRMPNLTRIKDMASNFSNVDVYYFGALSFAMPIYVHIFGNSSAQSASDQIDQWIGVRRSAFKFVLVAQGLNE